jgi:hypothetical protein
VMGRTPGRQWPLGRPGRLAGQWLLQGLAGPGTPSGQGELKGDVDRLLPKGPVDAMSWEEHARRTEGPMKADSDSESRRGPGAGPGPGTAEAAG